MDERNQKDSGIGSIPAGNGNLNNSQVLCLSPQVHVQQQQQQQAPQAPWNAQLSLNPQQQENQQNAPSHTEQQQQGQQQDAQSPEEQSAQEKKDQELAWELLRVVVKMSEENRGNNQSSMPHVSQASAATGVAAPPASCTTGKMPGSTMNQGQYNSNTGASLMATGGGGSNTQAQGNQTVYAQVPSQTSQAPPAQVWSQQPIINCLAVLLVLQRLEQVQVELHQQTSQYLKMALLLSQVQKELGTNIVSNIPMPPPAVTQSSTMDMIMPAFQQDPTSLLGVLVSGLVTTSKKQQHQQQMMESLQHQIVTLQHHPQSFAASAANGNVAATSKSNGALGGLFQQAMKPQQQVQSLNQQLQNLLSPNNNDSSLDEQLNLSSLHPSIVHFLQQQLQQQEVQPSRVQAGQEEDSKLPAAGHNTEPSLITQPLVAALLREQQQQEHPPAQQQLVGPTCLSQQQPLAVFQNASLAHSNNYNGSSISNTNLLCQVGSILMQNMSNNNFMVNNNGNGMNNNNNDNDSQQNSLIGGDDNNDAASRSDVPRFVNVPRNPWKRHHRYANHNNNGSNKKHRGHNACVHVVPTLETTGTTTLSTSANASHHQVSSSYARGSAVARTGSNTGSSGNNGSSGNSGSSGSSGNVLSNSNSNSNSFGIGATGQAPAAAASAQKPAAAAAAIMPPPRLDMEMVSSLTDAEQSSMSSSTSSLTMGSAVFNSATKMM